MSQIPVYRNTYVKLNLFKSRALLVRGGKTTSWDDLISIFCILADRSKDLFEMLAASYDGEKSKDIDFKVRPACGKIKTLPLLMSEQEEEDRMKRIEKVFQEYEQDKKETARRKEEATAWQVD